jgi:hypothetical protein
MPTLTTSGTQATTVIGTEYTLSNPTGNKFYTAYVDLTNMASGDTVEIRVSAIIKSAGSYILYYLGTYSGAQSNPLVYIAPLPSDIGWKLTIKQTAGSTRNYDYRVYEV